ncbi:hypothetical protein Goari_019571 [Gossypium aridum]|uniref:DUF4283 domain-containing protein n=1 Tax=Gossypium aridum TaxID=34290 RepID=A0A7J8WT27_GOSAI|nr:hypothetical protein [Gossypium aridum]
MSENLFVVEFVVDASPTTSNIGIGSATKKYLNVRPWSPNFSTTQNEIDTQAVWVRLLGLPKGYYSDFLLKAIGQTIGPILKIHENIDSARMGHFALLTICVNLRKPLWNVDSDERIGTQRLQGTRMTIIKKNKDVKILEGKNFDSVHRKKRNIGESSVVLELSKPKDITSKNTGQEPLSMDVPRSRKPPDVRASRSEHIMVEGIWLLWSDNIKVDVIDLLSQMVNLKIFLDSIASSVKEPWILAGDFNSILDSLEHDSGVIRVKASCNFFDFLFKNKLRDMGFSSPRFTWSRGLQAREFELCQEIEEVLKHECHIPKLGLEVWRVVLELWPKIGFENS